MGDLGKWKGMTIDLIIFLGLAIVAVATAASMLMSRNAVYSALFLVMNFLAVATLYLLLNAAFIAMVQVTVYAGAIMVLFLFVIMLLGTEREDFKSRLRWQAPVAVLFGLVLIAEIAYTLFGREFVSSPANELDVAFGSPTAVGTELFTRYLIPFEATSILLLVAMVGAIVLTRLPRRESS